MVDRFGTDKAFEQNVDIEMQRNGERYARGWVLGVCY